MAFISPFWRPPVHLLGAFRRYDADPDKPFNSAARCIHQRSRRSSHRAPFRIGILFWASVAALLLCCCLVFFAVLISAAVMTKANELGRRCHAVAGAPKEDFAGPRMLKALTKSKVQSEGFMMHRSLMETAGEESMVMQSGAESGKNVKMEMAMVTCTDGGERVRGRSFAGLMEMVAPNKQSYAERHGYRFIDASDLLDRSRPPSWSKILAVRHHLPLFQWVFWNDADSVVTNPGIRLEDILIAVSGTANYSQMPDLVVTRDVTGVNAGMFFFRNTEWSMQFLDLWWNQTSFIREIGQMKSGDNDALKYLLARMPEEEFRKHVSVPQMQCAFNSYPWGLSLKNFYRMLVSPGTMWRGVFSTGDFMVHLAGINEKKASIQRILSQLQYSTEGHTWRN